MSYSSFDTPTIPQACEIVIPRRSITLIPFDSADSLKMHWLCQARFMFSSPRGRTALAMQLCLCEDLRFGQGKSGRYKGQGKGSEPEKTIYTCQVRAEQVLAHSSVEVLVCPMLEVLCTRRCSPAALLAWQLRLSGFVSQAFSCKFNAGTCACCKVRQLRGIGPVTSKSPYNVRF